MPSSVGSQTCFLPSSAVAMTPPSRPPAMAWSAAAQAWAVGRAGRWGFAHGVLGLQRFWATPAATVGDQLSSDGGATFGHCACMVHGRRWKPMGAGNLLSQWW